MTNKPTIPKGTRDFSPLEVMRRNYIFDTIKQVFQRFGFLPIETPAMEDIETLTGKYGDEGDKLLFRILNSGNPIEKYQISNIKYQISDVCGKGLRYDLTVPFARYVVMHQNEIAFPFKRYQIQPVWRADRPQRGRYREFYQCDADVIGSDSLLNEVEIVQMIDEVMRKLQITNYKLQLNNRKFLDGLIESIGAKEKAREVITLLDKYEKVGWDNLQWNDILLSGEQTEKFKQLILREFKDNSEKINFYKEKLSASEIGTKGIEEVEYILTLTSNIPEKSGLRSAQQSNIEFSPTLARGLSYYTGSIFEVKVNDPKSTFTGSICGGGRYDDLTGVFGLPNVSGVGISFGADRIYDVLEELNLFPDFTNVSTKVLFACFGEAEQKFCLPLVSKLRAAGINTEIYPDVVKIKKQFDYANKKSIPYVVVVGSDEMQSGNLSLKNMTTGEQKKITMDVPIIIGIVLE